MMELIQKLGCHRRADRSFFYKGKQFPCCARCTGVILGQLFGYLALFFAEISWEVASYLMAIMYFDWYFQQMGWLESTNTRRFISGIFCGFALGQCYVKILIHIIEYIKFYL